MTKTEITAKQQAGALWPPAGVRLWLRSYATPLGPVQAGADHKALYFLHFADTAAPYAAAVQRAAAGIAAAGEGDNAVLTQLAAALAAYFAGRAAGFAVPLYIEGHKPFYQAAWAALRAIPPGQTRSYSRQAALMGLPGRFARACGSANARNPFPLIVPCHRVIAANGRLSGYNGGLWRKQWLLAHEKRCFAA